MGQSEERIRVGERERERERERVRERECERVRLSQRLTPCILFTSKKMFFLQIVVTQERRSFFELKKS